MSRLKRYGHVAIWITFVVVVALLFQKQQDTTNRLESQTSDLCVVVANVHDNAKFQFDAASDALDGTLKYLANATPAEQSTELYKRVRSNLSSTRSRVAQTRDLLAATAPPPSCTPPVPEK